MRPSSARSLRPTAFLQVKCLWDITPAQESLITSIVFCGTMIGAYSWGVLGDAKGRRMGFFATAIFTFIFGVLSAASPNYTVRSSSHAAVKAHKCLHWDFIREQSLVAITASCT